MTSFYVGDTVIYTPTNGKPVKSVVTLTPSIWRRQGGFIGIRGVGKVRAKLCRLAEEMPEPPLMQRASGKWITAADILPALTEANK